MEFRDMETTMMSINRWMDKEVVVHVQNGILLSNTKRTYCMAQGIQSIFYLKKQMNQAEILKLSNTMTKPGKFNTQL